MAGVLDDATTAEVIDRILDGAEARVDEIGAAIYHGVCTEIPAYFDAADDLLADVRDQCDRHARLVAPVLREDRVPRRDELAFARDAAARRAHRGVPLDAYLQAFRIAHRTMLDAVLAEAQDLPHYHEAALALARRLIQYIDTVSTQVAEAYLREEHRIRTATDRERRDLLESLLIGRAPHPHAGPHPAAPGLDPTGPLVLVVAAVDGDDGVQAAADALGARLSSRSARALVVVRLGEVVAIAAAPHGEGDVAGRVRAAGADLEERGIRLMAGVSAVHAGFGVVPRAHTEAAHALAQASPERPVVALAEIPAFEYLLVCADAATRNVIAAKAGALARLSPTERGAIAETIVAYAEHDLNIKRTAEALGLHANTIRYRLDRTGELTGLEPRRFGDVLELLCMLELSRCSTT